MNWQWGSGPGCAAMVAGLAGWLAGARHECKRAWPGGPLSTHASSAAQRTSLPEHQNQQMQTGHKRTRASNRTAHDF
eukprot:11343765-Alexandrium_andersonii.AAC.1